MEKLEISKWNDGNREEVKGVILSRGDQHLDISLQGNMDLYFSLNDYEKNNTFVIGKDNHEVFDAFDELYNSIMGGKVVGLDSKRKARQTGLIKGKKLILQSDDCELDAAPFLEIERLGNAYLLKLDNKESARQLAWTEEFGLGFSTLTVRLRNDGTNYDPLNIQFMELFNKLRDIDTNAHQIHMDEYLIDRQLEKGKSLQKILCSKKKSA